VRIAVLNWGGRRIAGAEAYLAAVIPALRAAGHAVALAFEDDQPTDNQPIAPGLPSTWCVSDLGPDRVIDELRQWQPDVLYAQGLQSPALEAQFLDIAPAALVTQGFYGTCISGAKSFKAPVARPCDRRFGWRCLLHYYPHRCGGLSPITMVRDYRLQGRRLALLRRYAAIVTPSRRMETEYLRHGIPREQVHRVPFCVQETGEVAFPAVGVRALHVENRPHIVFLGRMTVLKGGHMLLRALPEIQSRLGQELRVTFGGDGPARTAWEEEAARLSGQHEGLEIAFSGWLSTRDRDSLLDRADLLVVPSVWPDPFPFVGIEAARRGVPAVAFGVGGIPDWLESGLNGFLAPADPPTPRGLAIAVVNCLSDPEMLARLRVAAMKIASRWSVAAHLARLEPILASIARRRAGAAGGPPREPSAHQAPPHREDS
jgi:glycosyltransferase involved in cell wall biosynthesis